MDQLFFCLLRNTNNRQNSRTANIAILEAGRWDAIDERLEAVCQAIAASDRPMDQEHIMEVGLAIGGACARESTSGHAERAERKICLLFPDHIYS